MDQKRKDTITLVYIICEARWKSSEHIYENHLNKLNSLDFHLNILFFFVNQFITANNNII